MNSKVFQDVMEELMALLAANSMLANGLDVTDLVVATITAKTGSDAVLKNAAGKDLKVVFSDAAGARKLIFYDSADEVIGSIDSNGLFTAVGGFAGDLTGNVTGNVNGKCRTTYAHTDTEGAPTNAECVSAFGAAATVGAGFIGIYQDDHAGGKSYVCVSNGATYSVAELTAAA
jgi:hypothetical protein